MHNVTFVVPERDLGRADVEFNVSHQKSKLGTLKVSKGSVVWVPKDHTHGYKMKWKDFDKVMQDHGEKES